MAKRESKSPYQRYQKTPYRYSAHLRTWESAIKAGNTRAAEAASREHAAQFGYRRNEKRA